MEIKKPGTIHPKKTLFLRTTVGTAEADGLRYEMSYTQVGTPLIRSKQTGKWFELDWTDILSMAEDAGIDQP